MYRAQGTQGSISDLNPDVNVSLYDSPVHWERYNDSNRSGFSPYLSHDTKRPRGCKSETQDESSQVQRQRIREKEVVFSNMYLDAGSPERFSDAVGHRGDTRRGQSEDYLAGAPGSGDITGDLRDCGGYKKSLPKRLHAGESQRGHLPPAPAIPRLPTPDFESASHYETSLAKYHFCPCCSSDDRHEQEGIRWKNAKAKMDRQIDNARAYISRITMRERLIRDA
ncbi:hypothetical protein GGR55DRAFT_628767 [Xylaria sp. FL0064]|nr:hypothetical protein GGR55DRAFT_628767 [Xylaria sp. FL0064]